MANRIVEVTRDTLGNGLLRFNVLFLYPVNPPLKIDDIVQILRPLSTLPDGFEAHEKLTRQEVDAISAGTATFKLDYVDQRSGESHEDTLARAQRRYAKGLRWIARERVRIANFGRRHNEA